MKVWIRDASDIITNELLLYFSERAARRNQCLTGVFINRKQLRRLLHGKGMWVPKRKELRR